MVSEKSLAESTVQSFLWSLAADDNWALLEREGFVGSSTLDLRIMRRNLLTWFAEAEAQYPQEDSASGSSDEDSSTNEDEDFRVIVLARMGTLQSGSPAGA